MSEIIKLVQNFTNTARERLVLLAVFIFCLIFLDALPTPFMIAVAVQLMIHAVQMYLVNKSLQAHFSGDSKFDKEIEIIDAVALVFFLISTLSAIFVLVLL